MAISATANNTAFAPGYNQDDLRNLQAFQDNPNNTYYQNRYNEIMLKRNPNFFAPKPATQQQLPRDLYGNTLAQRNAAAQYNAAIQQKMLGSGTKPVNKSRPSSGKKSSKGGIYQGVMDFDKLYSALTFDGTYNQSDVDTMSRYLQEAILGGSIRGDFGKKLFSRYNKPTGNSTGKLSAVNLFARDLKARKNK